MRILGLLFAMIVLFSSGCIAERKAMFNEDEFRAYAQKGNAVIFGDAFLKTRGGEIRKAAGNTIYLTPATAYTAEWIAHVTKYAARRMTPADPRYFQYERTTTADGDGRFEFTDLPPGHYFVATKIVWDAPTRGGLTETGGWVYAQVEVAKGDKKKIVVTHTQVEDRLM